MSQDKFPHPTNQWIEEEVDMPVFDPVVNEAEGRVEFNQTTKKVKQKTYYADSPARRVVCAKHEFVCLNKPRSIFKCTKCDWTRTALPVTYRYNPETKELLHRETGQSA